jgi:hypothetical protein
MIGIQEHLDMIATEAIEMSEETTGRVTYEGEKLIKQWVAAEINSKNAEDALYNCRALLANSIIELGKWLCPIDAELQEKFCVWYGDSLIQASKLAPGKYEVLIRSRGKSLI